MAVASDSVATVFDAFREELEDHNDRRERLIKAGRDITKIAKAAIFLLHRIVNEDSTDQRGQALRAAQHGRKTLVAVQRIYASLRLELTEYIEALGFAHYLEHRSLITFDQVQHTLSDEHGVPYFPLPISDYLLGLADLTGELMRFAISGFNRRGGRSKASEVCAFVRGCKADFERLTPYIRELNKKQAVTAESLEKIENAVYAVVVRGSEYDLPPEMLDDIVAKCISDFSKNWSDRRQQRITHRDNDDRDEEVDVE